VGERQPTDGLVRLPGRAQLRQRAHRGGDPSGLAGQRPLPQRLVHILDVVDEMQVVGSHGAARSRARVAG
jgi:hypothetical protein